MKPKQKIKHFHLTSKKRADDKFKYYQHFQIKYQASRFPQLRRRTPFLKFLRRIFVQSSDILFPRKYIQNMLFTYSHTMLVFTTCDIESFFQCLYISWRI